MTKILISACFLGHRVRYNGVIKEFEQPHFHRWNNEGRLIVVCPEVAGGLGTPRPPAEIQGADGEGVWNGDAKVVTNEGDDVTAAFKRGAEHALKLAQDHDCQMAVLKARSPSCGSKRGYDGSYSQTVVDGIGVTAALLKAHGIFVFSEEELEEAQSCLERLDSVQSVR